MNISLKYGEGKKTLKIPDHFLTTVIDPPSIPEIANPEEFIHEMCENPFKSLPLSQILTQFITSQQHVDDYICIVIPHPDRQVPILKILHPIDHLLQEASIPDISVKILIANGTQPKLQPKALKNYLSMKILTRFDVINHDATDNTKLSYVGESPNGMSLYLNPVYTDAKMKILIGEVAPHYIAGYSGGSDVIFPGIAGMETIKQLYCAKHIGSPFVRYGSLKDNPVFIEAQGSLKLDAIRPDFVINVCLNPLHDIVKVGAGNYAVHDIMVQFLEQHNVMEISKHYDIVICTNGGFPFDSTLYDAIQSISLANLAVKPEGIIISVNQCRNGIGNEKFEAILHSGLTPAKILQEITTRKLQSSDLWQMQFLARILRKKRLFSISSLNQEQLGNIGVQNAETFDDVLKANNLVLDDPLSVLILSQGLMIVPKILEID